MTLVVDSSVAMKWFVEESGSQEAAAILAAGDDLVAPDLIRIELANIGWKKARPGQIKPPQVETIIADVDGFFSSLESSGGLLVEAFSIAREIDHPIYDCVYLACARRHECRLATDDRRLINKCKATRWRDSLVPLQQA